MFDRFSSNDDLQNIENRNLLVTFFIKKKKENTVGEHIFKLQAFL